MFINTAIMFVMKCLQLTCVLVNHSTTLETNTALVIKGLFSQSEVSPKSSDKIKEKKIVKGLTNG